MESHSLRSFEEKVAVSLFHHDRDKPRPFDTLGYVAMMYGTPPCGWEDLAEPAKEPFRQQARVAIEAYTSALQESEANGSPHPLG